MLKKDKFPLVSIIVITYNSAKFVVETLESCKAQTYHNIELIVSDDGSTDDTCFIVRNWLASNSSRFTHHEFLTVPVNTGIPANCNRGVKASKGEWIKFIAGDDALYPSAINSYLEWIGEDKSKIYFSYSDRFSVSFIEDNFIYRFPKTLPFLGNGEKEQIVKFQFDLLTKTNFVNAPTTIMHRDTIFLNGFFDERFPNIEDYPMWLKLSRRGYQFVFIPMVTVMHRIHKEATDSHQSNRINKKSYFEREGYFKYYVYPYVTKVKKLEIKYTYIIRVLLNFLGFNKDSRFFRRIDYYLSIKMNPFRVYGNSFNQR